MLLGRSVNLLGFKFCFDTHVGHCSRKMHIHSVYFCAAIILSIAHHSLSYENQTINYNVTKTDYNDLNLTQNISLDKAKPTKASFVETTEAQKQSSKDGQLQDNTKAHGKAGELKT